MPTSAGRSPSVINPIQRTGSRLVGGCSDHRHRSGAISRAWNRTEDLKAEGREAVNDHRTMTAARSAD